MQTLKMYGGSDDLIESSGIDGCDEFNICDAKTPCVGSFLVKSGGVEVFIHAIFYGAWAFAVTAGEDDADYRAPIPWPVRRTFGIDCEYSETLEIDVPDDARLSGPIKTT